MTAQLGRAVLFLSLFAAACGAPLEGEELGEAKSELGRQGELRRAERPVPEQYIVVLRDDVKDVAHRGVPAVARELAQQHAGTLLHVYEHALRGFAVRMPEGRVRALAADPRVAYVEEDGVMEAIATQSNATWGIDRADQRDLPLSGTYTYNASGAGVNAYIVDTGIRRSHSEFGGRAVTGYDAVTAGGSAEDCNGHGTHVAGTVGGATWGLAKSVKLYAVRVLDCNGSGTTSGVIAGVDWVTSNHVKPAVANMSLGGGASSTLDNAVANSVSAGVTYAVAAGNDNQNACNYSPARVASAMTVGSTTSSDARSSFSNWGSCLDIFAPGSNITSAWHTGDTATNTISGTSMASPHMAGAVALYLETDPGASPATVVAALTSNSTPNKVTSPGTGSPNKLLYTGFIGGGGGGGDTTAPTTSITSPASGATLSGTVTLSASASDNVGVSRVEFYVGSSLVGTDTSAPYSVSWNSAGVANGGYSITSRAYDAAGNVGTSAAVSVTVSNGGGSCSLSEQLLLNPGFESGNVSWTATSGVIDNSATNAHSGSWKAWLNGYGSPSTDTLTQDVTLPSSACSARLEFWLKVTTSETTTSTAYDKLTVQVLSTSGSVLGTLATYSNLNKGDYVLRSFDLAAYRGQTVRISFKGTEDWLYATSFFVDDTAVSITR